MKARAVVSNPCLPRKSSCMYRQCKVPKTHSLYNSKTPSMLSIPSPSRRLLHRLLMLYNLLTPTITPPDQPSPNPHKLAEIHKSIYSLPTRVKPPLLRKPRPRFPLRTDAPRHCRNTHHYRSHDRRVRFPIRGLRVPASGRGPDVLWVAGRCVSWRLMESARWGAELTGSCRR